MRTKKVSNWRVVPFLLGLMACITGPAIAQVEHADRIQPYTENPYYWQYEGEPVMLLGGSWQDNLFNHPNGLEEHLDLLVSVGGNYVRNVMSSRTNGSESMSPTLDDMESGAMDEHVLDYPWPFARDEATGLYDLDEMGAEYWERFARFLEITAERDIIVQIELFDRFDYFRLPWQYNPFNPRININYTEEESGLPEFQGSIRNAFFRTVPELENNTVVLPYQQAFVDKLLSIALPYGHVLYCISNETRENAEWGAYWAQYIRDAAAEAGVEVHVTEMWGTGDLTDPMHLRTFNHPEIYTYVEISQNNWYSGSIHWNDLQYARDMVADNPRPINNVKIYATNSDHGMGIDRLWQNVLGGSASMRFHRPYPLEGGISDHEKASEFGLGLSPLAQVSIRAARDLVEVMDWPNVVPDVDMMRRAEDNKATVRTEKTHVVYTRDADGLARLFMDGDMIASMELGGDFSNWHADYRLALGGELSGGRYWQGSYHAVNVYSRALAPEEISSHFDGGDAKDVDGLQAMYRFNETEGVVVHDHSGQTPALDLLIEDSESVSWREDGLELHAPVLIATEAAPSRLIAALQESNAITLEAWITPGMGLQEGPARIVTLSENSGNRNFTLGQEQNAYQMRLRTTETSGNGLPALQTHSDTENTLVGMRTPEGDRAAVLMRGAPQVALDWDILEEGLQGEWLDPRTATWREATPNDAGHYQPPTADFWLLVLR